MQQPLLPQPAAAAPDGAADSAPQQCQVLSTARFQPPTSVLRGLWLTGVAAAGAAGGHPAEVCRQGGQACAGHRRQVSLRPTCCLTHCRWNDPAVEWYARAQLVFVNHASAPGTGCVCVWQSVHSQVRPPAGRRSAVKSAAQTPQAPQRCWGQSL
jgi:hypothetical protein